MLWIASVSSKPATYPRLHADEDPCARTRPSAPLIPDYIEFFTASCQRIIGMGKLNVSCRLELMLAPEESLCYYFVMRSTRRVVNLKDEEVAGRYSDPPLLVLASLANGPKHGHAMIEDIAQMSGTRLGPGTLYGAIARLEAQGRIEALPADDRRQPYQITAEGLQFLRAQLNTLNQFAKAGLRRLASL
jgi:DNA-binding MarR family transcriptional regulator